MKKSLILFFIGCLSFGFLSGQIVKDSLGGIFIYPQFHDNFSAEESWEIHKEAYIKQLKAEGLTVDEIEKKMEIYEQKKKEFIEKINEQRKIATLQRAQAEEQRKIAAKQRAQAEEQRKIAAIQREEATIQRQEAEEQRKQVAIQRKEATTQRAQAKEQRRLAAIQRQEAAIQRAQAEEQRKLAEEWRNSFERILTKKMNITPQSKNVEPIVFEVNKRSNLHFSIQGEIITGTTLIEIFNPDGKKEGELSLENTNTKGGSNSESQAINATSGSINKTISDAKTGNWQIRVSPEKSEGTVHISVAYYNKPNMND